MPKWGRLLTISQFDIYIIYIRSLVLQERKRILISPLSSLISPKSGFPSPWQPEAITVRHINVTVTLRQTRLPTIIATVFPSSGPIPWIETWRKAYVFNCELYLASYASPCIEVQRPLVYMAQFVGELTWSTLSPPSHVFLAHQYGAADSRCHSRNTQCIQQFPEIQSKCLFRRHSSHSDTVGERSPLRCFCPWQVRDRSRIFPPVVVDPFCKWLGPLPRFDPCTDPGAPEMVPQRLLYSIAHLLQPSTAD